MKESFDQYFCKVTPLSKYLSLTLFIISPFIGGYVGYHLKPNTDIVLEKNLPTESIIETPIKNQDLNNTYTFKTGIDKVEVLDAKGAVVQTISLADIPMNYPPRTFTELEVSETWPLIIETYDVNFDSHPDLGILADTSPIESGYVFYLYNPQTKLFEITHFENENSDFNPVIYEPTLDSDNKLINEKFTITNPRSRDYTSYRFDSKKAIFSIITPTSINFGDFSEMVPGEHTTLCSDMMSCFGSGTEFIKDLSTDTFNVYGLVSKDTEVRYGIVNKQTGEVYELYRPNIKTN
jgi:hypothetical protein